MIEAVKRTRSFLFAGLILAGIICAGLPVLGAGAAGATVDLGQGLSAAVTRIRVWEEFDGDFPADEPARNWVCGNEYIEDYNYDDSSKLAAGSATVTIGASSYTKTVESFASFRDVPTTAARPRGSASWRKARARWMRA